LIRHIQGTSLIEYPGSIASVLFSAGCNLSCPFCHNPELVYPDLLDARCSLGHDEVINRLREREGFIDAVVLTGGEPLLHSSNLLLMKRIKEETGLKLKLDTNGTFPERLGQALEHADFVAMDIKSSPDKYIFATGGQSGFEPVRESGKLLLEGTVPYEFRSTMVPGVITDDDVMEVLDHFAPRTVARYALQRFRSEKTLSSELTGMHPYPAGYIESLARRMARRVPDIQLRV
jgi:pyruvate formate lyase activating enzyme